MSGSHEAGTRSEGAPEVPQSPNRLFEVLRKTSWVIAQAKRNQDIATVQKLEEKKVDLIAKILVHRAAGNLPTATLVHTEIVTTADNFPMIIIKLTRRLNRTDAAFITRVPREALDTYFGNSEQTEAMLQNDSGSEEISIPPANQ